LSLFPNLATWSDDTLFNLAAHAFLSPVEDEESAESVEGVPFSPHIYTANIGNKTGLAAHVNAFLKPFGEKFALLISSHSNRHSAVDIASEHFQVLIFWIVQRGDWSLDAINTFFEYLGFSSKNDRYVARALAGYADVTRGIRVYLNLTRSRWHFTFPQRHLELCIDI
jgi:hypothetical protein